MTSDLSVTGTFTRLMSPSALNLLVAQGSALVKQMGIDLVRDVVLDILTGKNLRDSTEVLTRRRIATLNLALVHLLLRGSIQITDFVRQMPYLAADVLKQKRLRKEERWLAQWILGLTDKGFQNVLRDNPDLLISYRDWYVKACQEAVDVYSKEYGELTGTAEVDSQAKAELSWLLMVYLLNTVGAQTLAIRGSEKSTYGKLFERLVLGSLLHILGFKCITPPPSEVERVFWLCSRSERRESDATLLYAPGRGVRFDIGFIGRGNPEISLDKVTRYEHEMALGESRYYMATLIIVDRIGANSRIEELARQVGGTIIQMSGSYWPQEVARELNRVLGLDHELVYMEPNRIHDFLRVEMRKVPLEEFIRSSAVHRYRSV